MMMDRNRLSFWTRLIAILLAAGFLVSSVLIGFTVSGSSYNLLEVLGGDRQQDPQQQQSQDLSGDIDAAERRLKENPEDPAAIQELAQLYVADGQSSEAIRVLEDGTKRAPDNAEIPSLLGGVYGQQAQAQPEGERAESFRKSGDAFASATERDPKNEQAFAAAGDAYEQAGDSGKAIQYYNGYLDLNSKGETADQVRQRIDALLNEGGSGR